MTGTSFVLDVGTSYRGEHEFLELVPLRGENEFEPHFGKNF